MKNVGKAYGFFDCNASKEVIESELPTIRELVKTPSKLELSLIKGVDNLKGDSDLMSIAREAKESGIKYVIEATYPDATNKETADELASILIQAYQTPLYQDGEQFYGSVFYKELGKYVPRD